MLHSAWMQGVVSALGTVENGWSSSSPVFFFGFFFHGFLAMCGFHVQEGRIHGVVMCTAASNETGWVHFLRMVLETWFGSPVYDHVIDGTMIMDWHADRGSSHVLPGVGCFVKDMDHVRHVCGVPLGWPVIAVDDRPHGIVKGTTVIPVLPYRVAVNLVVACQLFVDEWTEALDQTYRSTLQTTWVTFSQRPHLFTARAASDTVLHAVRLQIISLL